MKQLRISKSVARNTLLSGLALGAAGCALQLIDTPAQAARQQELAPVAAREPWPARRPVLLLPLQLGEGWNADRGTGQMLLPASEDELLNALKRTRKFSIMGLHRFNPVLMRAVQDRLISVEDLDELIATPSLENARELLSNMTFEQNPLIADFRLERIQATGSAQRPVVQVQISGRLYELNNPVALNTVVVTSDPVAHRVGDETSVELAARAAGNAFNQAVAEFVAPLPPLEFPPPAPRNPAGTPAPARTPAPTGTPAPTTTPAPVGTPAPTPLPPDLSVAGASSRGGRVEVPQLPPAQPPLGIAVPDEPTVPR